MKELKGFGRFLGISRLRGLWNPVKELKVASPLMPFARAVILWNPVKELKGIISLISIKGDMCGIR